MKQRTVGDVDYRGRPRIQTVNNDPSETVQSDAHLADIQNIMQKFGQGGMEMLDETKLHFADVSEFTDLGDALRQAIEAELEFMKLPSKVREIFKHDVATWLDTAFDEDKRDALVEAGFIKAVENDPEGSSGGAGGGEPAEETPAAEETSEGTS